VIERASRRVAYVHLRSWASAALPVRCSRSQLLRGELADAEALVLDLRGGWGGANADYLSLFDARMPELAMTSRQRTPRAHPQRVDEAGRAPRRRLDAAAAR
jgi:carboxyl-terminal processing protease